MNKLPFCIINYLFQKLDIVDIIKYSESCKINHDLFIKYKNKNPKVAKVINAIKCNSPRAANLIVELEDYSLLKFITSQTVKITSKINLRFLEKLKISFFEEYIPEKTFTQIKVKNFFFFLKVRRKKPSLK